MKQTITFLIFFASAFGFNGFLVSSLKAQSSYFERATSVNSQHILSSRTFQAQDGNRNLYLTGNFARPSITFENQILLCKGNEDLFLVKKNTLGEVIWAKSFGRTYSSIIPQSIASDSSGNIYLTGYFQGDSIVFGNKVLKSKSIHEVFIAKFDSNGNVIWAKNAGNEDMNYGSGIIADNNGNVYLTGWYNSKNITFDSIELVNNESINIFLVKFDTDGHVIWAKTAGNSDTNQIGYGYAMAHHNLLLML